MLRTKVEVKLKKAEPGSWAKLNIMKVEKSNEEKPKPQSTQSQDAEDDAVDLDI